MNQASKPAARGADLTVIFSHEEKDSFRRKCNSIGSRAGTEARRILNAWNPLQQHVNIKLPRRHMEYPSHGHFVRASTSRAARGGAPMPRRI
ncbi:hypothetical protein [Janthinobacterium sp. ROICE36]|uniref:hypothetical protein n=1 Tax=Janthinobacterium sp. ROICE36 TaxID=2048670 RepID=UPI0011AF90B1|nr:hypothetical protein [Janthinobacterium sp. ROICE36]